MYHLLSSTSVSPTVTRRLTACNTSMQRTCGRDCTEEHVNLQRCTSLVNDRPGFPDSEFVPHPPPLLRERRISLPVVSDSPLSLISILLADQRGIFWLDYDFCMPPFQAYLRASKNGQQQFPFTELADIPATNPVAEGPITIRLEGIWSPVTIIAGQNDTSVVTVWDIVVGVYRAARSEAVRVTGQLHLEEYNRFLNKTPANSMCFRGSRKQVEEQVINVIFQYFGCMTRWAGLRRCPTEINTWFLTTKWSKMNA